MSDPELEAIFQRLATKAMAVEVQAKRKQCKDCHTMHDPSARFKGRSCYACYLEYQRVYARAQHSRKKRAQ